MILNIYNKFKKYKTSLRIKRYSVIGKQEDGGVALVDIELKFKALKSAWSKILVNKDCILNHLVHSSHLISFLLFRGGTAVG